MRLGGAAGIVVVLAVALAGCGSAEQRSADLTINLPSYERASSGTGHLVSPDRRIGARSGNAADAQTARTAVSNPVAVAEATPAPQIKPLTPAANAKLNGVSVWIPYWGLSEAVSNAIDNAGVIKVAHPFMYELSGTSSIVDESGGQGPEVSQELAAAHIDVIPTITETDGMGTFATVLTHPKQQAAMLKALESVAEAPNNDGIDLDFENLAIGDNDPKEIVAVENLYPRFVDKLCAALHQTNRSCEVTVMAKNTPGITDPDGLSTFVYDYSALGKVADRVQIMAYDDHTPGGASGPIAPWPWVESVLDYTLTQVPSDKVVLGVPAYGYDWNSTGDSASTLTAVSAEQLAAQEGATIEWNSGDAEPYFSYSTSTATTKQVPVVSHKKVTHLKHVTVKGKSETQKITVVETIKHQRTQRVVHHIGHVVWFENSTANYDRAVLAADDKLAGIAIWAGGDESPGLWSQLAKLTH